MNTEQKADRILSLLSNEFSIYISNAEAENIRHGIVTILKDGQMPETPTLGAKCQVRHGGSIWNATVKELYSSHYSATILETDIIVSNIPFTTWRPI